MSDKRENNLNIPCLLRELKEQKDLETITRCENIILCKFASPFMLACAVANFILRRSPEYGSLRNVIFDSIALMILFILYEAAWRIPLKTNTATHIISLIYALFFILVSLRFYWLLGPAVWTIGAIQIILAFTRLNSITSWYIGAGAFLSGMYMLSGVKLPGPDFKMDSRYLYMQAISLIALYIIVSLAHNIVISRNKTIRKNLETVTSQKEEISALYEEIAATEEELRDQYDQLSTYNNQIVEDEKRLKYLAYFDTLTELPNRKMIMEKLDLMVRSATDQDKILYIVFIDIDHFKIVNDTMGHHSGDMFVHEVATRLKDAVDKDDLLGRMGGDEFVLIIRRDLSENDVYRYVETVRESFSEPFTILRKKIRSSASFGISVFPKDGENAIELLKYADTSMYKAKVAGKNKIQFFDKKLQEEMERKIDMEYRLANALQNNEFYLVFQPQYNLEKGHIRGFEALVRWRCPDQGIISPLQFIPLAEETGLIIPIGEWILKQSCRDFVRLRQKFNTDAVISVNISAVQIKEGEFVEIVKEALEESGLEPEFLELEITESVLIDSVEQTINVLNEIKKIGVRIALDDFGTGYSSFNYLKKLPINILKIDKSFIDDLGNSVQAHTKIIRDIISLAHNLDIMVLAEGVEHEKQKDYLKEQGCDFAQGYLFGKPMEHEILHEYLVNKV